MKILFISDIHGVPSALEKVLEHAQRLQPDKLVLLGDLLYHGPRNGVPGFYDPVRVASVLNANKKHILAVRGNCDSEVDQMMLEFPMQESYAEILTPAHRFFLTHGHRYNEYTLPPLASGTILVHGHTHIPVLKKIVDDITVFNPGSISLPKGDSVQSFGFFDGDELSILPVCDSK